MSKRSFERDKMSCTVMYQPYAMSTSTSSSVSYVPPEKKPFRFPYVPSPPDSLHSDASSYSHSSPGPSLGNNTSPLSLNLNLNSTSSSTPTGNGNGRRPITPLGLVGVGAPSYPSATITSGSLQQHQHNLRSPQPLITRHVHNGSANATATATSSSSSGSSSASATVTSHSLLEEEEEQNIENVHDGPSPRGGGSRVQYLSANCIVYENYQEETARVVEEHFNRALSAATTKGSLMQQRNFPPSFWNSNYQPQSSASKPFMNMNPYSTDFYGSVDYGSTLSGLSHHHQTDPWHYPLTSHQSYHHRPTDLSYPPMPSTSRFNAAQYGSFFLGAASSSASRFGAPSQCGTNLKSDTSTWASGLYHHPHHDSLSEINLADYAAAHYTNRTGGLETTVVGQETSKDAYWF